MIFFGPKRVVSRRVVAVRHTYGPDFLQHGLGTRRLGKPCGNRVQSKPWEMYVWAQTGLGMKRQQDTMCVNQLGGTRAQVLLVPSAQATPTTQHCNSVLLY